MAKDCIRSPRNHAGTVHLANAGACHRAADADKGSGTQKDVLKAFANGLYPAACAIVILTGPSAKKLAGISEYPACVIIPVWKRKYIQQMNGIMQTKKNWSASSFPYRRTDFKDIPVTVIRHEMPQDELEAAFPDGKYRQLPDEVYKRLEFHPASFEVKEHHVAVYAGTDNETIVKARRQMEVKPLVDAYFAWAKIPARISE